MLTLIAFPLLFGAALKSFAILAVAALLAAAMKSRSAAERHLVWTGACAALIALPLLSVSLPAFRAPVPRALVPETVLFRAAASPLRLDSAAARIPAAAPARQPAANWRAALVLLWIVGAALSLFQMLAAALAVSRVRRHARPLNADELTAPRAALAIPHRVALLETAPGAMPMTIGLLRPAVLLPAGASAWTRERRDVVLLHELAHVRRGDVATHLLARFALCLYWWNPLAWFAWRAFLKERERAADDLVLNAGARASAYAGHLLEIARTMQTARAVGWGAVAMARPSQLETRMEAILDSARSRRASRRVSPWAAAALAVACVAPVAALHAQNASTKAADEAAFTAQTQGNFAEARVQLDASLAARGQQFGLQSKEYGVGLSHLAGLVRLQNRDEAVSLYTRAQALLGDTEDAVPALTYLGIAALGQKNYDAAMQFLQRAEAAGASDHPTAQPLLWMAIARDYQGQTDAADESFRKAIWQAHGYPNGPADTTDQELYAAFLHRHGRDTEAAAADKQIAEARQARPAQPKLPAGAYSLQYSLQSEGVYRVGPGIAAPKTLNHVDPQYTEEARVARYQGTVVLNIEVGADGAARNIRVVKSLGLGLAEEAAAAVSQWKFQPATKDGQPVPVSATVEVNFKIL